jgi:hypothetical protein
MTDVQESLVCTAVRRTLCIGAMVRDRGLILAPHVFFALGGRKMLAAVTIEIEGRTPSRSTLEVFDLSELHNMIVIPSGFSPNAELDLSHAPPGAEILCAVRRAGAAGTPARGKG